MCLWIRYQQLYLFNIDINKPTVPNKATSVQPNVLKTKTHQKNSSIWTHVLELHVCFFLIQQNDQIVAN